MLACDGRAVVELHVDIQDESQQEKPTARPSKVLTVKVMWRVALPIWLGPRRMIIVPSLIYGHMPTCTRPFRFVHETMKSWEWPGDEARAWEAFES